VTISSDELRDALRDLSSTTPGQSARVEQVHGRIRRARRRRTVVATAGLVAVTAAVVTLGVLLTPNQPTSSPPPAAPPAPAHSALDLPRWYQAGERLAYLGGSDTLSRTISVVVPPTKQVTAVFRCRGSVPRDPHRFPTLTLSRLDGWTSSTECGGLRPTTGLDLTSMLLDYRVGDRVALRLRLTGTRGPWTLAMYSVVAEQVPLANAPSRWRGGREQVAFSNGSTVTARLLVPADRVLFRIACSGRQITGLRVNGTEVARVTCRDEGPRIHAVAPDADLLRSAGWRAGTRMRISSHVTRRGIGAVNNVAVYALPTPG
jgi:hypothetical protein